MNVTVDHAAFARALRLVGRVIPSRTTLPILQTVLIIAEPGRLILRASNVELALATAVAAHVDSTGQVAVPARTLTEWVSELPPEPVALVSDPGGGRLRARSSRFTSRLAATPAEDFPTLPAADQNSAVDLDSAPLRAAISRVAFAAATDDRRPVLAAVRLAFGPNGIGLAACDGFRLALASAPGGQASGDQFLVPARAIAELSNLLDGIDKVRMLMAPERRALHFVAGSSTLTALLLEGTYPDVERLVPSGWKTRVIAERTELQKAVHAARLFGAANAGHPVMLAVAPGRLDVRARGDERGDATCGLPATTEGDSQAICLNGRLLADVLDSARAPELELNWEHAYSPVVVRETDSRQPTSLDRSDVWLLMPLKDSAFAETGTAAPVAA